MERKSAFGLGIVCLAAVLVLAACGGGGGHTYVMTPHHAPGLYLTIVSPVALPAGVVQVMETGMTSVKRAKGPEACSYSREIKGLKGKHASLDGKSVTVKVNGSSKLTSVVCARLKSRIFNPANFAASRATHPKIGPTAYTAKNLAAESKFINTKFFWAGEQRGRQYEFTRTTTGNLYVRYLPRGTRVGAKGGGFLVVATYPFVDAYKALQKQSKGKAVKGPGGSLVYVRRNDPKSVLMAFPGVNDEIEIYDPAPAVALATAKSGKIKPVGS